MTTTKSFSDKHRFMSIFRTSLKQQIPFAIVSFIAFALLIGLTYFVGFGSVDLNMMDPASISSYFGRHFAHGVYAVAEGVGGVAMAALVGFALIVALIQHGYLHSKKMTDFYHSLPVKRPQIFCANLLASALVILVPFIAVVLFTMAAQLIQYGPYIPDMSGYFAYIVKDILFGIVAVLVVYIFTSFIAVCVGTVFDAFALTVVLGCTPLVFYMICGLMWSAMIYGADFNADIAFLLSPFTFVFDRYMHSTYDAVLQISVSDFSLAPILIWAGIGLVLFFITVIAYNRRRSELAEQTQPQGIFQIITKCVVAFCGGILFFAIFFNYDSLIVWFFAMLIGALVIGIVVEIVLSRGIRSLKKNVKWLLISGLLSFLVLVGVKYDITGAGTYVPDVDDIASVSINYGGRFENIRQTDSGSWTGNVVLDEPATLAIITEAHRLAANNIPPSDGIDDPEFSSTYLSLDYTLDSGRTISRYYYGIYGDAAKKLVELETNEEYLRESQMLFAMSDKNKYTVQNVAVSDSLGNNQTPYALEQAQLDKLLDAACTDMLSETYDKIANPTKPAYGYLTFQYYNLEMWKNQEDVIYNPNTESYSPNLYTFTVLLTEEYTRTLALMEQYGIYDRETAMPTAEDVGGVIFANYSPHSYGWGSSMILNVIENTYSSDAPFDEIDPAYNIKVTDKAIIETVLEKGRSQMLCTNDAPLGWDVIPVDLYDTDGNDIGTRLMRWNDVPAEIQQQLIKLNQPSDEMAEMTDSVETKTAEIAPADVEVIGGADEATGIAVTDDAAAEAQDSADETETSNEE